MFFLPCPSDMGIDFATLWQLLGFPYLQFRIYNFKFTINMFILFTYQHLFFTLNFFVILQKFSPCFQVIYIAKFLPLILTNCFLFSFFPIPKTTPEILSCIFPNSKMKNSGSCCCQKKQNLILSLSLTRWGQDSTGISTVNTPSATYCNLWLQTGKNLWKKPTNAALPILNNYLNINTSHLNNYKLNTFLQEVNHES